MSLLPGGVMPPRSRGIDDDVIEIGLLLPAKRAEQLVALSRIRHQSVGQILRSLIDQALSAEELAVPSV